MSETKFDPDALVTGAFNTLLPLYNKLLPARLKAAGLDPYPDVYTGSKNLYKNKLLGTTVLKVKVKYKLSTLVGLSTMVIESFAHSALCTSDDESRITGKVRLHASYSDELSIRVKGSMKVTDMSPMSVSARLVAKGASSVGKGTFILDKVGRFYSLKDLTLTDLSLDYDQIKAQDVKGFGPFDKYMSKGVKAFSKDFKGPVRALIAPLLEDALRNIARDLLPLKLMPRRKP